MKRFFTKPTLFLLLGIPLILIGIPAGIYGITLGGGTILGGILILGYVLTILVVLFVDRLVVKFANNKILSIIELFVLLLGLTIHFYENRTLKIKIENHKSDYILIIENPGNLKNDYYLNEFLFNKYIATNKHYVIIDKMVDNIDINMPTEWDYSYSYNVYEFEKYPKVKIFSNPKFTKRDNVTQNFVDSLINN
jgi:hypothetical protein